MNHEHLPSRGWAEKFADAFRGVKTGLRGQVSFYVHIFAASAVVAAATIMEVSVVEWCILALCITIVFVAEMLNTAMELLARAITSEINPHVGSALDIGSAAVLLASIGASIVGAIVFVNRFGGMVGWWSLGEP